MPIQKTYKVNILDLNPNVGVGVSLPFNNRAVFNTTYTTREQVKSNLINFLLTNYGERVLNPTFGINLQKLLFSQIDDLETIKDYISDRINIYLPDIIINKLNVTTNNDHSIIIEITFQTRNDSKLDIVEINFNQ